VGDSSPYFDSNLLRFMHKFANLILDFGSVLWSKVHLQLGEDTDAEHEDASLLSGFLADRPSAWKGIKSFEFTLNFSDRLDMKSYQESCSKLIGCIATHLQLERLVVNVGIYEWDVEDMIASGGRDSVLIPALLETRNVPVSREFVLDAEVGLNDKEGTGDYGYQTEVRQIITMWRKHVLTIRDSVMPDSLREKEKTEVQLYLLSRSAI